MTGAPSPLAWRLGAVLELIDETPHAKTIVLDVPDWPGHLAGQHVDIRLTAEDDYRTERSYSIGSPPEQSTIELTVQRIDDSTWQERWARSRPLRFRGRRASSA